ncbi:phosphoribosylglycinamide formyltransferase activity protein [Cryphonectria parasitica EP155]|uniref:Phosphoribosylglycinamide formyltransferase n=1 Tax=Cryphonectria parasitica (strain ATCC 38755 / EP155) TaxID=660469 RepID=A0A9P4XVZ2_CRYP1|nr:phosphoribosylglycinamide formyltransferase activity protein [Cryphonectria parasitica EP155]KAF3762307.1 phosphoribosylglycinamide formyltransferase activity protein [Cryphonectria parasitica EP155]
MASSSSSSPAAPCRIVVMASGSGSNFQALLDGLSSRTIRDAQIVRLFVNRKTAYAVTRAEKAGVPSEYFNMVAGGFQAKGEKDPERLREARTKYDAALAEKVLAEQPDLVVLAGWMHVFTEGFLKPVADKGVRVINLHPALPGRYDGAGAIERAYQDFQAGTLENNKTGIMIHYVIAEVDRGEPIMTREIECREGETLQDLEQRIHSREHELIVAATAKVVGGILAERTAR